MMVVNLKKMMPEVIRERLQTLDLESYSEAKEYAIKQARALRKNIKPSTLDHVDDEEEETEEKKKKPEGAREEESQDSFSNDDWLAWMGKGPGKGNKGSNPKGGKGKDGKWGVPGDVPLLWHLRTPNQRVP